MKIDSGTLLIGALLIAGIYGYSAGWFAMPAAGVEADEVSECSVLLGGNTQTLGWTSLDLINKGTNVGSDAYLWINGVFLGSNTRASNSITPNSEYVLFAEANATYYGHNEAGRLPCEPVTQLQFEQAKVGTMNFSTLINSDGITQNVRTGASPQAIGTGQTVNVKLTVQANETDTYITSPEVGKYMVSLKGNGSTTCYDFSKFAMAGCNSVGIPSALAGDYVKSFDCPDVLKDFAEKQYTLTFVAKTSCDPNENVTIRFDDYAQFFNDDELAIESGIADEDDTGIAGDVLTTVFVCN